MFAAAQQANAPPRVVLLPGMSHPDTCVFRLFAQGYDGARITRNAWDSNFCSVNPKFIAVVEEAQGGGSFLVSRLFVLTLLLLGGMYVYLQSLKKNCCC